MKIATVALAVLALGLAACGADAPPPPKDAAAQPAQPLPNSNVFKPYVQDLNKAKNVQKTVDDQKKAEDQAIQDQGG